MTDSFFSALNSALRTLFAQPHSDKPSPQAKQPSELDEQEQKHAAGLMRVNHVGEVCAQALYTGQALVTKNPSLRAHLLEAAREEGDHLAWTYSRLQALHSHTSLLNPLWYSGAFALGAIAGKLGGDRLSLGFVVETENQVEAHLAGHLKTLPLKDHASRAIVQQMKIDEARHAQEAQAAGAKILPKAVAQAMRCMAKFMTTVAYRI